MNTLSLLPRIVLLLSLTFSGLALYSPSAFAADEQNSFKVHNKTQLTIKRLLVSEDKRTWGKFDIGDGITSGQTVKLIWDRTRNNEGCKHWVKVVFSSGEETPPALFDFCLADLLIEFEE